MEFKFQDILKNIIPGVTLLVGLVLFFNSEFVNCLTSIEKKFDVKDCSEIILFFIIFASYLLGYVNDAISSWGEHYFIYTFLGTPSLNLFRGGGNRIFLAKPDEILQHLKAKKGLTDTEIDIKKGNWFYYKSFWTSKERAKVLFKYANDLKNSNPADSYKEKINEFYNSYIFSRNIFFSYLIGSILFITANYSSISIKLYLVLLAILILLGIRRRDKSYYYSRQVLQACKY